MTVIATASDLIDENENAVKLSRYWQVADYAECAGYGVFRPGDPEDTCNPIWSQAQRRNMAKYLREAQDEIEQVCGYPLAPRWIVDEPHPYYCLVHARWTRLLQVGVRAVAVIQANAVVDHASDPAVIGPLPTIVTNLDEIAIFHPGTEIEICPSKVTLSGGMVTIEVPRCRMVTAAAQDNPDSGLDYNDVGNCLGSAVVQRDFECFVDVAQVYNDDSTQGSLVYAHRSSLSACQCGHECKTCGDFAEPACLHIDNRITGSIDAMAATYSGGSWKPRCGRCYGPRPNAVLLNYRAGMTPLSPQAEDAIIRLAHAKMPKPPCGCGSIQDLWSRDRNVPTVLTAERENCPFGMSDGAWISWRFANAMTQHRISVI